MSKHIEALEILERNLAKQLKNLIQNIDCKSLIQGVPSCNVAKLAEVI